MNEQTVSREYRARRAALVAYFGEAIAVPTTNSAESVARLYR